MRISTLIQSRVYNLGNGFMIIILLRVFKNTIIMWIIL